MSEKEKDCGCKPKAGIDWDKFNREDSKRLQTRIDRSEFARKELAKQGLAIPCNTFEDEEEVPDPKPGETNYHGKEIES